MVLRILVTVFLLNALPCSAQDKPVVNWAEYTSFATAAVGPTVSIIEALKTNDKKCNLLKLGLKEAIGNSSVLVMKHFINSPRPCIGCSSDGMPSGHTSNGFIGSNWQVAIVFGTGTGVLRHVANKHTWPQIIAGAATGVGADLLGNLVHCSN